MLTNALTQYQTSFRVLSKDERPPFGGLQNIVYGWVLEKERDRYIREDKLSFFKRCDWNNLWDTRSSRATNFFTCNEFKAWAFRYVELDKELASSLFWYTDIGIKEENNQALFYARVSYSRNEHDLNSNFEAPQSSVPRFIRYILDGNYKTFSQGSAFGIFSRPIPVQENGKGHGKAIADIILSNTRRYPIIVCNGGGQILDREAQALARDLAGKCQVIQFLDNPELAEEFRMYLPKELWVTHGKLRVYFGISGINLRPHRHRFFDPSDPEYPSQRKGIINGLLRNHTLEEQGCIQNISEIGRLITLSKLGRFKEENPGNKEEVDEIYDLVAEIEKERDEYKIQADYFAREHDSIEAQLRSERSKRIHFDQMQITNDIDRSQLDFISKFSNLPEALIDVVKCFAALHASKLVVSEAALTEAMSYKNFTEVSIAWEMFYHLTHTLHKLKFESDRALDLEKVFHEQSGYELSMSEGRQTKRNSRLMALRQIECDGKPYDITPHLKWGNSEPKMLRINFAFDEDLKKIIIGYVGPHLENATSRKKR